MVQIALIYHQIGHIFFHLATELSFQERGFNYMTDRFEKHCQFLI